MKQKILICGATGFVGRNLLESFINNEGYDVRAVWHKPTDLTDIYQDGVKWVHADLTQPHGVKEAFYGGVDIVLQYAAVTSGAKDIVNKPYIHVTDNAIMNSLLMREAFDNEIKHFIFPSCSIMYQSSDRLIKEDDFDPSVEIHSNYYGAGNTKVYLEKMCKFYSSFGKTKFSVLRQSNIYGKYDKFDSEKSHVLAASIIKVAESDGEVLVWGDGQEERDLLHISDLVNCVHSVLLNQKSNYELINVGYGKSVKISYLVEKILDIYSRHGYIKYDTTKPTIKTKVGLDIEKAQRLFKWTPKTTLDAGIKKTIDFYNSTKRL